MHLELVGVLAAGLLGIGRMDVKRADSQVGKVVGDGLVRMERHAPVHGLDNALGHLARRRDVLAARELHRGKSVRIAHNLLGGTDLGHMAVGNDADAVAEPERLVDVVAHVEHRGLHEVEHVEQGLFKRALEVGVKGGERLVEHEDAGTRRNHARKRHALLLAAGKASRIALGELLHGEDGKRADGRLVALLLGERLGHASLHILLHRQVGEELVVLEEVGGLALLRGEVDAALGIKEDAVVHNDASLVGRLDAGDTAHGEALAATGGAQKSQALLTRLNVNVEVKRRELLFDVDIQAHGYPLALSCASDETRSKSDSASAA